MPSLSAYKEVSVGKKGNSWIRFGYSFRNFSLGIRYSKGSFDLDLCFFWIGADW